MSSQADNPPNRRERDLARHRQEILDAAVALFAENGFHATTMQMIAERAEFSVGYLYKHFPGKEEMYQDLVRYHTGRMDELLAGIEALGLPPLEQLRRSYEVIADHFNHHRDFMQIFHQEIGALSEDVVQSKRRHFEMLVQSLADAQAAGELKPFDPQLLAATLQGATKELLGEMARRESDHAFADLPATVFALLIDPLRN